MRINKILFVAFLLFFALLIVLYFRGSEAFSDELAGVGKLLAIMEFIAVVFIFRNAMQFRRLPVFTVIILIWLTWSVLSALFFISDYLNVFDWLIVNLIPAMMWSLSYLIFYVYFRINPNPSNWFLWFFLGLSGMCCLLFIMVFRFTNTGYEKNFQQLAYVFFPLATLPWVLLSKSNVIRNIGLIFLTLLSCYSLKRSVIIAVVLSAIVYYIVNLIVSTRKNLFLRIITPLVMGSLIIGVFSLANSELRDSITVRFEKLRTDEGSGRLDIYQDVFQLLSTTSQGTLMIGRGLESTTQTFGITAHNDFLEVLFDFGIIGLAIYICFHLCIIWNCFKLIRLKSVFAPAFSVSYVIFFTLSMFSHLIIYPSHFIFLSAFWGMVQGSLQCQAYSPQLPTSRKLLTGRSYEGHAMQKSLLKGGL